MKSVEQKPAKHITLDMFISGLCKIVALVLNYIYIPIVLKYLGVEKYGIWSTILTILSWIGYFDLGIGNGLRNRLTESLNTKKEISAKKLVSSTYALSSVIMMGICLLLVGITLFVKWEVVFGVANLNEDIRFVLIESIVFVCLNFVFNLYVNVLYAFQKAAVVGILQVAALIINLIGVLTISRFIQGNLTVLALIYGASTLLVSIVFGLFFYSGHPDVAPSVKEIDLKVGQSVAKLGFMFFFIQICALVLFATDSLIISTLYGAANVTPYSTVNSLFMAISGIYAALLAPSWSAATKSKTEKNTKEILNIYRKMILFLIPFALGTVLLVLIFRPFSIWWLKEELDYSTLLIVCGGVYCFLNMWCNIYAYLLNGMGILKPSMIIAGIQAVVNIPLSVLFAKYCGFESAGVLLGTVLSMAIAAVVQPFVFFGSLGKAADQTLTGEDR